MIIEDRVCLGGVHTRRLSVPGSGVPIALLHGFADSADTWRGVLTAFQAAGRAAFAVASVVRHEPNSAPAATPSAPCTNA
jgi:pimeloyl-ACP methyl ester carboxylesterase